jgi:hypothetical protein
MPELSGKPCEKALTNRHGANARTSCGLLVPSSVTVEDKGADTVTPTKRSRRNPSSSWACGDAALLTGTQRC